MKAPTSPRFYIWVAVIVILFSTFLRIYNLTEPNEKIFDEVYFPVFANNYLTQTDFFDAHPPLGKLIIAVGIALFDNVPLGWRAMNAVFGVLLLLTTYGFTYTLTKNYRAALLALFILAIEPMALVESRVGLINIYLAVFSILGAWTFWKWWAEPKRAWLWFTLSILSFSAATGVKWIGLGGLAACALAAILIALRRKKIPSHIRPWHLTSLLLLPTIYLASFIPDIMRGQDINWWHSSSFGYHAHLDATHPYGSTWWSWAFMIRPIWLFYSSNQEVIRGIIEIGNIVTWIGGLFFLLYALITQLEPASDRETLEDKDRNLFLSVNYLALYLPWIVIGRVKFIYHYFVPVIFLLILLAILLEQKVLSRKDYRLTGWLFLILATGFFIYFLPLLMAWPISQESYRAHMWLKSWI